MASVQLGRAQLALFADPSRRVVISALTAAPYTLDRDRTFVRFAGDQFPTAFHGEGREFVFALSCRFARAEHADLLDLQQLIDVDAPAAVDQRLLLRTHFALAAGLDVSVAVELEGPLSVTPDSASSDVTLTIRVVNFTFEV